MVHKIAVFDLDGTLIKKNIGTTFVKYLISKNIIPKYRVIYIIFIYFLYKLNIIDFKYAIKIGYEAFAGISVQNIDDLAVSCFLSEIKDNIFQDGLKEIQELKKKDYKILLATGAHMSIALIFSKYIEADYCVATKSIVINDHYTRKGIQPLPYKEGKRDLVLQKINEIFGDEERIITVYTDEKKDLPLLSAANIYVAVNADKQILDFIHLKGGESKIFK